MTGETELSQLPGVGAVRSKKLAGLGLETVGDLLRYYPRTYEDRTRTASITAAPEGTPVCVEALVAETPRVARVRKGLEVTRVKVADGSAVMQVTFFNQSYLRTALHVGEEYIFFGTVERSGSLRKMTNPEVEPIGRNSITGCIVPVYRLTAGISNRLMLGLVRRAVEECAGQVQDELPRPLRMRHQLAEAERAYRSIHFPDTFDDLSAAVRRLAFEEFFYLTLGMTLLKRRRTDCPGRAIPARPAEEFEALLPFSPTAAQKRAMGEIAGDLQSRRPMNRLVQGDVGSGKTAVAAYAAWLCVKSGCQCAMMAPTEILAEQHYRSLSALLRPAGVRVGLLTGGMRAAEKRAALAALAAGEIDLAVGTHALISEGVSFRKLGLVITDEQHRFGVQQRAALAEKAGRGQELPPHVLVMSATPIPRTLALILYGDLDVSVLDELPPGRTPVDTFLVGEDKRARMYGFVRKIVGEGRQAYIVCPAVEESEPEEGDRPPMDLKAVKQYAEQLQNQVFPDLRVDLLHGRMRPKEKERVMAAFAAGDTDVLVSTTVIEVGMDVPNAALMIVENAERFGLSQLHQLRGRVGRGTHKSYCVLVSGTRNEESRRRLRTLCATTDGFRIAEEDLKLRGPGDFFGSRQHGLPELHVADLTLDMRLLKEAQSAAEELLRGDPELTRPEHRDIARRVERLFAEEGGTLN